ncbi:hypothetical protein D9M68_396360 [compost metagenome]
MLRAGAGEDVHLAGHAAQFVVVDHRQFGAGHRRPADADAQLRTDGAGGLGVVAGDHLHPDAGLLALLDGGDGLGARRVDQADQGEQGEALGDVGEVQLRSGRLRTPGGQGQQAQAARGGVGGHAPPVVGIERGVAVVHELPRAHLQDAFRGALDQYPRLARAVPVAAGHETVLGLEGNAVQPRPGFIAGFRRQAGLGAEHQQRALGGVAFDAPLAVVLAQQRVVAQHAGADRQLQGGLRAQLHRLAVDAEAALGAVADAFHLVHPAGADHALHGHLVAGQGAGLVRADHRHRAQGFHRRQAPDDGLLAGHALHAEGQGHGHDRRQPLGDGRGHQRHHHHEHFRRRFAAPQGAEQEHHEGQAENDQRQGAAEAVDLAQQRGGQLVHAAQHLVDPAQLGRGAGGHHQSAGLAEHHQGAGVGHAVAVAEGRVERHRVGALFHRQGFPGERRLVDAQFLAGQQAQVGRHPVAGCQQHQVAGHQVGGAQLLAPALADHRGAGGQHAADGVQRRFGPAFLDETDHRVDQHGAEQHAGVDPLAERGGDQRGGEHHVEQDVVELQQQAQQRAAAAGRRQAVLAVLLAAAQHLGLVEACGAAAQLVLHLLRGKAVPGRRGAAAWAWDAALGHGLLLSRLTMLEVKHGPRQGELDLGQPRSNDARQYVADRYRCAARGDGARLSAAS